MKTELTLKYLIKRLHFIHADARSLYHKMSKVRYLTETTNVDVIDITETQLDDSYTDDAKGL